MDIGNYIENDIFNENNQHKHFYQMIWDCFIENGFVITDEDGYEIDTLFKAFALKNLLGEFVYRIYDEVNEIGFEDIIENAQNLGFDEADIEAYCESDENIFVEDDFELTVKNALDYITEISADKMLEEFAADDIFDAMFACTYAFEQDFVFDFEDYEEMLAFIDNNQDQLDDYKEEYSSVSNWIHGGMMC
ncbi:MAG: hypothetical protein J1E81_03060 [Eubacterium sp.]|nr:hypothetical protein [Eubacterium sp.]